MTPEIEQLKGEIAGLSARIAMAEVQIAAMDDDIPEPDLRNAERDGGTTEWSGRVLDLHGTVIFELDPEASPPVVIGNVYLLIDTTKEGEDAVSFSSSVGATPRYITYEVGVSDGAGGYTKKSGYVCGDIRVPLILGGDEFSVLTQTEGTGGIDMGYLRAIGGSVP